MIRLRGHLLSTILGALLIAGQASATEHPVQVLLQGSDATRLRAVLTDHGGTITHELPIIHGIGGIVSAGQLDSLEGADGVERLVEDFNPPEEPEIRDCPVAGNLDIEVDGSTVRWRLYNFSDHMQATASLHLSWPETFGAVTASVSPPGGANITDIGMLPPASGTLATVPDLPPGVTTLHLNFERLDEPVDQNDLSIRLSLDGCSAELPAAYRDNAADFYFPSVVGADLLNSAGITGRGVTVAIIDSGLWNIPALTRDTSGADRVVAHYDARKDLETSSLTDPGGHGSHMASIVANSDPVTRPGGQGFKGIAPDARLLPITAFSPEGDGDFLDIARGIQWAVQNRDRFDIRVLNLSLSATPRFMYWDDPINQAVFRAWQAGITVVAAAGNDGPDWGTIGSPGNNPYVITVGAVTDSWTPGDRRDDYIPDFSSRGPSPAGHIKPDLVAPGGHITGLVPPDSALMAENPNYRLRSGEFVSTGSSQAAAVVSGIAALLIQANPELSNDDIKCLLKTSAEPAINRDGRLAYSPFSQGEGYANASRALTLGSPSCDQDQLDIDAAVAGQEKLFGPAERREDDTPSLPGLGDMLSSQPAAKGFSEDRRWGARDHLERLEPSREPAQAPGVPFDWAAQYEFDRLRLEALRTSPSP